jgi:hypothetical protein
VMGDWTIKDILNHLTFWEGQMVTLLFQAQRGLAKPTTAHFSSDSVDTLNQRWYEEGKQRPLEIVWKDWLGVRKQAVRRVSELSETDLSDPKRFAWLEGVPLIQWVLNDTVAHEEEHADQIREWLDAQDNFLSGSNGSNGSNGSSG